MGHRRDPFQRRKFSISIALKTSFYSWPVHWSGFCSKRRFCGRDSLARERDSPAGGKVCWWRGVNRLPISACQKFAEKRKTSRKTFLKSRERRESRKSDEWERKARSVNWNCKINVQRYSVYNGSSRADGGLSSFHVRISSDPRIFGFENTEALDKSDFGAFRYKNFHAHGRSERSQPNCFAFRSFLSHFRSRGEFSPSQPVSMCCVWLFIHSQQAESLSNSEGNVYPTSEQVPVVFLGFRNSWVQSGWRDGKGNKKKDRKNRRRT